MIEERKDNNNNANGKVRGREDTPYTELDGSARARARPLGNVIIARRTDRRR